MLQKSKAMYHGCIMFSLGTILCSTKHNLQSKQQSNDAAEFTVSKSPPQSLVPNICRIQRQVQYLLCILSKVHIRLLSHDTWGFLPPEWYLLLQLSGLCFGGRGGGEGLWNPHLLASEKTLTMTRHHLCWAVTLLYWTTRWFPCLVSLLWTCVGRSPSIFSQYMTSQSKEKRINDEYLPRKLYITTSK